MKSFVAPLLRSNSESICSGDTNRPIAWLDQLLKGGFDGPMTAKLGRPQIILVAGPPGAGKSLLVQQICYNIANHHCQFKKPADPRLAIESGTSLYLTTEASAAAILANLESLGLSLDVPGDRGLRVFGVLGSQAEVRSSDAGLTSGTTAVPEKLGFPLMCVGELSNAGLPQDTKESNGQDLTSELEAVFAKLEETWLKEVERRDDISLRAPHLVAIDSLNVFPGMEAKRYLFEAVLRLFCREDAIKRRPKYVLLVLEVTPSTFAEVEYAYFEHVSDISIRLDHGYGPGDYFTRSLEIKKHRFKSHALGRHVVKIFPKPEKQGDSLVTDPEGARPHLSSGGVFVFPSVHFVLSSIRAGKPLIQCMPAFPNNMRWAKQPNYSKNEMAAWGPGPIAPLIDAEEADASAPIAWDSPSASLNWPTPWCFELVGGGVPLRQCTALVGHRGARKSYFGYQFLLDGIVNGERTLVVSFRDNPDAVLATMHHIARAPHYRATRIREDLSKNLVVIYQRAGYVTPEELLHRVITAVGEYQPTRVVISSVDQWEAGYPLLAKCSILVPALIDFFNTHKVTSMIVGVEGGRSSITSTGLTARAEVVLSFDHQTIRWPPRKKRLSNGPATDTMPRNVPLFIKPRKKAQSKVIVRAVRVPRGAAGYGRAIVDYMVAGDSQQAALTMLPLAPEYPSGDPA